MTLTLSCIDCSMAIMRSVSVSLSQPLFDSARVYWYQQVCRRQAYYFYFQTSSTLLPRSQKYVASAQLLASFQLLASRIQKQKQYVDQSQGTIYCNSIVSTSPPHTYCNTFQSTPSTINTIAIYCNSIACNILQLYCTTFNQQSQVQEFDLFQLLYSPQLLIDWFIFDK